MSQPTHPDLSPPDMLPPLTGPGGPPRAAKPLALTPGMTPTEALAFIDAFAPCGHTSYDTEIGDRKTWVKCYDCDATVARDRLPQARERAEKFGVATDVLHWLIAKQQDTPTGNPKPSPAVAQASTVKPTSGGAAYAPRAWALQDDRSMFAMAGIDWSAPHDIDPEPRCEGIAFDPHDVCGRVGVWCAENTPWLSPVGWEGAGGECGGGA